MIFYQFISMLALIEDELMRSGLREIRDFFKLTGRARSRALPVDHFRTEEVPLFLLCLETGGRCLNLTASDTVIYYVPWWNPAAEHQGTDRAHRIGRSVGFVEPMFSERRYGTARASFRDSAATWGYC